MPDEIKKKYSVIYFILAGLHLLYFGVFIHSKSLAMVYFNILSFILYIILGVTANRAKNLVAHFLVCFVEVLANAVFSSVLCGMSCGFSLFFLAILPIIFYSVHMLYRNEKNNGKFAIIDSGIVIFLYLLTWFLDFAGIGRVYHLDNTMEHVLYFINMISTILILMGFLMVFVAKVADERQTLTQEKEEIENSANYDTLTRLLNRRSLDKYFDMAIRKVSAYDSDFSILMCDIDNFKKVNDTYGHDCGDQVLKNIADIIKGTIRSGDVAFRWGGEEILIMVKAKGHIAKDVAERIRKLVESSSVVYKDQEVKVTITIGGASYYQGVTKDELVSKADDNLYTGKNNGKNQVVM